MPKFPTKEADILSLAQQIIAGLNSPVTSFPTPPLNSQDLQQKLDEFIQKRSDANLSQAAAMQDVQEKNQSLDNLSDSMKTVLRYAENTVKDDSAKLQEIGWDTKSSAKGLQFPQQPRSLEVIKQGDGWVFLDWKEPVGGGAVSAYKIQRRERAAGNWIDAGTAIPSEYTLIDQPKGIEIEYRIIAVNRTGDSSPSNSVRVVL